MRSRFNLLSVTLLVCVLSLGCRSEEELIDPAVIVPGTEEVTSSTESEPAKTTLAVGDPAPPIAINQWVVGDPVDASLTGGRVHVVEFWATWCGPCRVGMPHISELQQHHGDEVAFIGVTREDLETVTGFLEEESPDGRTWDEVIQYRIAIDSDDQTNDAYMKAAGQNGIPTAFIVGRDGFVEWIGHPARIDGPLQQVVDGTFDREKAIAEFEQQKKVEELTTQLREWAMKRDWDKALATLDEIESQTGPSPGLLMSRMQILENAGRTEEAAVLREKVVELAWDDASTLNGIAWGMATGDDTEQLELALRAAERAAELTENKDAAILDTVARVHYEMGQLDEAIKWQRIAVENNDGFSEIEDTLQEYLDEKARNETAASDAEASAEKEAASDEAAAEPQPAAEEAATEQDAVPAEPKAE